MLFIIKLRERSDEGHREVASILQSPADWLSSEPSSLTSSDTPSAPPDQESGENNAEPNKSAEDKKEEKEVVEEPKGKLGLFTCF